MNSSNRRMPRWYVVVTLITVLSMLAQTSAVPVLGGSGGPFVGGLSAPSSTHPSTQFVLPSPGDVGVNTWNGNLVVPRTDLFLPARGIPLELQMVYNSQRHNSSLTTYGPGWRMSYHIAYSLDPFNGNFVLTWGDGNTSTLPVIDDHLYAPSNTPELVAIRYAPGKYRVRLFDGTTYTFDNATHRRVTREEDLRGNAIAFTYDGSGNLTQVANTSGGYFNFTYTAGRLIGVTDSAGRSVQYQYNSNGDQTRLIDTMGVSTTYAYSGTEHLLINIVNPEGQSVAIGYSAPSDLPNARRVAVVQAPTLKREFGYARVFVGPPFPPARTLVTDTVGAESRVTAIYYDDLGRLKNTVDAQGRVQSYMWDTNSNLLAYTDRNNKNVTYAYDARGNVTQMTDASGRRTYYTWEPRFNSLTSVTDPLGRTTSYRYDTQGNLIGIVDAQGNATNFEYDAYGQLINMIDARGHVTRYAYDAVGNQVRFTNALGQTGRYQYDAAGNVTAVTSPDGTQATIAYDAAGEATRSTDPLGHTRIVTYTKVGLVSAVTDEVGRTTAYGYDARGRVTQVTDALGGSRQYAYDGFGYLTAVTDPNNHTNTFGYDRAGRVITETNPLGQMVTYGYDGEGHVITQTDAIGQVTTFAYDALGRHIRTIYPDSTRVQLGHDAAGNVITATGPGFTYTYGYDENKHLVSVFDVARSMTTGYTYDAMGNRRSMTDPDGGVTYYFYDALDRLERLVNPLGETTIWQYNQRGLISKVIWPNDTWAELSYDALGRITDLAHRKAGGAALAHYTYTYDAVGNRLTQSEDGYGTTAYTYDALNRLVRATGPDGTLAYAYDAVGNRLTLTDTTGITTTYTYNAADQLLQSIGPVGTMQYQYDHRGNLITSTIGTTVTAYAYNGANRLTQIDLPDGTHQTFTYDQSGLRRSRTDASGTINYFYDFLSQNLLMERQGNTTVSRYTTGLEMDELISQRRGGSSIFYHVDALGSVIALSDPAQNIVAGYRYDPFGKPIAESGANANPFRFTGRPWDQASGLYDVRQRVYDPAAGRFLTPDPVRVPMLPDMATHPYAYVGNNPVTRADNEGLFWNPIAWLKVGIGMVTTGIDVWRKGGSLTDIAQAVGISGLVDSINALLGGAIPNAVRDPVKNLIGQIIDWMRGKRCEINWGEFIRSIGVGLIKDIAGALFKAGAIGKDTYTKLIDAVHGGAQSMLTKVMGPKVIPVAESGPCQKRREQPPVVQEQPRRQPPSQFTGRSVTTPVGDQGGRHGGGYTGSATVTQLTPNPIRSGSGQPLTHLYQVHNMSTVPGYISMFIYYNQQIANPTYTASQMVDYASIGQDPYGTYMYLSFIGYPGTTIAVTTTGMISPTQPVQTGQVIKPDITVYIGDEERKLDSPTEVGDGGGNPAPSLALRKSDKPDPVTAGNIQTYTLEVENTGGVGLTNVIVTETYPVSVTYQSATPLPSISNYRWNVGSLAPQQIKTITVTVQTAAELSHGDVLTNVVQSSSDQTPRQTVTETAKVRNQPALAVMKTSNPWPPQPGGRVTFTLGYANQGSVAMQGLVAVESFDPRLSYVSASPLPNPGSNRIWSLGALNAGASGQITVVMQVPATLPYSGTIHNETVFFARQVEPVVASLGYFANVGPTQSGNIEYVDAQGLTTTVQIPAGAVPTTTTLVFTPLSWASHPLAPNIYFAGHAFNLEGWRDGQVLNGLVFQKPVTLTTNYSDTDITGLDENSLALDYWNKTSAQWQDAATTCAPSSIYDRHTDENKLAVPLCHLSDFALLATPTRYPVYLPLVLRATNP
jgi:RHS repeat-associated protein/uncharacterized repeat protein (TIGR01451 family)